MAVRLPALSAGRRLPTGRFRVLMYVRESVDPRAIVRLEGLGLLKNPMASSEIETATYRLVAKCLIAVRDVSKERRQLVCPRASSFCYSALKLKHITQIPVL
jgi:hypothetical protein